MKVNALSSYDQIKGLMLEKLKESLGLPQYLNSPPCSLSSQKYNPHNQGIKNSKQTYTLSSYVKQLILHMLSYWYEKCINLLLCLVDIASIIVYHFNQQPSQSWNIVDSA